MKKITLLIALFSAVFCFAQCTGQKANADKKADTEMTYIIMFKTDATGDFEEQAKTILQQADVSPSKVQFYYSSIKGVAVKLTEEQAKKMQQNPNVTSNEADQKIEVDLPKPEGKQ